MALFGLPPILNGTRKFGYFAFNLTKKGFGITAQYGFEAAEGVHDAVVDVLVGESQNETQNILNETLAKMRGGAQIVVPVPNEQVIAVGVGLAAQNALKKVPSLIVKACPNLLY
jgi:hypothetical protein